MKLHIPCTDDWQAVAVVVTAGQPGTPRSSRNSGSRPGREPGWWRRRPIGGYDSDAIRCRLIDQVVTPKIPNNLGWVRVWSLVSEAYRERSAVERLVGWLKQYRRITTRYDRVAETFRRFVHSALTVIRLR